MEGSVRLILAVDAVLKLPRQIRAHGVDLPLPTKGWRADLSPTIATPLRVGRSHLMSACLSSPVRTGLGSLAAGTPAHTESSFQIASRFSCPR
eukprot:562074-Rhodomonas_salina.1